MVLEQHRADVAAGKLDLGARHVEPSRMRRERHGGRDTGESHTRQQEAAEPWGRFFLDESAHLLHCRMVAL